MKRALFRHHSQPPDIKFNYQYIEVNVNKNSLLKCVGILFFNYIQVMCLESFMLNVEKSHIQNTFFN